MKYNLQVKIFVYFLFVYSDFSIGQNWNFITLMIQKNNNILFVVPGPDLEEN